MQSLLKPLRDSFQSLFNGADGTTRSTPVAPTYRQPPGPALAHRRHRGEDVAVAEAFNKRFLELLPHRAWLTRVRVVMERDACLACRSQPYELGFDELPALPHRRCTRQWGCACWYEVPEVKRSRTS